MIRFLVTSVVLGVLVTAVCWLSVEPSLRLLASFLKASGQTDPSVMRLIESTPFFLGTDFIINTGVIFLVLFLSIGVPLRQAEDAISQASALSEGVLMPDSGPLASRLNAALRRLNEALHSERERNAKQLAALQQANDELGRLQAELVASDRLATVGKLAAGVAHEVGNPLAGILGYLSVLRLRTKHQPELLDLAERIEGELQRIDAIVRSLLELGRPSRGKAGPIDVRSTIDACVQLLRAGNDFRDVELQVDAPASVFFRAEAGPLSQVLINLLINAAQAMGGKGRVRVSVSTGDGQGFIHIDDEGPGIPPAVLERLFEPFFTTKAPGKGTGLGLAVSKHLLTQVEGDVVASNRPEGGARLTISLPAPEALQTSSGSSPSASGSMP